ncbi:MAG: hypothetical protein KME16_27525 [Scytolyngbya sp. HA4215-MV1]|nr:hypothetical protein [Scytolyngbya sp. HA4215-MV1]
MSHSTKPAFENDLGENPLLLAHITDDAGAIAVGALALAFIGCAFFGLPAAALIALISANDLFYCRKKALESSPALPESEGWQRANALLSGAVDVEADTIGPAESFAPEPEPVIPNAPCLQDGEPELTGSVKNRVTLLIAAMASQGFPIQRLIKHPLLWFFGQSQSGKSTIANLVNCLRLGLGYRVSYGTLDDDIAPLRWDTLVSDSAGYSAMLETLTELLKEAGKGSLDADCWTLDEFYQLSQGVDLNPLMVQILAKGAKTKGKVSIISQLDTLEAHRLSGTRHAIDYARVLIAPVRAEDDMGEPHPTGEYLVTFPGEAIQKWTVPNWMLSDLNQFGQPDPVLWVLNRIPELKAGYEPTKSAQAHPAPTQQQQNQQALVSEFALDRAELERLYSIGQSQSQAPASQPLGEVEQTILDVLKKVYPNGMTISKLQGQRQLLKQQTSADLQTAIDLLERQGKVRRSGANYYQQP